MLLAPVGNPNSILDLPNLSDEFDDMTAAEFDCWLSATPASFYRPRLAAERVDIDIPNTLRELVALRRERDRLGIIHDVQAASEDADLTGSKAEVGQRVVKVADEAARISGLLASAGLTTVSEVSAP